MSKSKGIQILKWGAIGGILYTLAEIIIPRPWSLKSCATVFTLSAIAYAIIATLTKEKEDEECIN